MFMKKTSVEGTVKVELNFQQLRFLNDCIAYLIDAKWIQELDDLWERNQKIIENIIGDQTEDKTNMAFSRKLLEVWNNALYRPRDPIC